MATLLLVVTVLVWLVVPFSRASPASAATVISPDGWGRQNPLPGSAWIAMSSGTTNWLYGVWGSSATNVFAVGYCGILHYNGSAWSAINSGTTSSLLDVCGSSATDVFAVGVTDTILHYNGSTWSVMRSGGTNDSLYGVWGSSATDVFAVGDSGTILHYNGSAWSAMSSGTTKSLLGVWGSSATDVFTVGVWGTILHYNGSAWSAMSIGTTNYLLGVWGSSATDVFAVEDSGTILHYNGSAWSAMSSGTTNSLSGVWGSSTTDVFAVGYSGIILHYNGSAWSTMSSGTTENLIHVWGSSATNVFAVGGSGAILHYQELTPAIPTIASVSPNQGTQGQTLNVTITGTGFTGAMAAGFAVGFGSGIAINSLTVDSSTRITANITISSTATLGSRDVSVTTPGGTGTKTGGFAVMAPAPVNHEPNQPSNVSPANGDTGTNLTPTLSSSPFSDPDGGDTQAASQWQITTTSENYSSPLFHSGTDNSNLTQITVPSGILNSNTTCYWRVRYQDNHGAWSAWSAETSFTVRASGPISQANSKSKTWWIWVLAVAAVIFLGGVVLAYYRHKRNTPPKQPPPPLQGNWEEINGLIRNVADILRKAMDDATGAHDLLWLTAVKFVKEELSDLSLGIQRGSIRYEDARARILDLKDRGDRLRNPPTTATSGGHPSIEDLAYLNLGVSRGADSYEILGVSRSASEEEVATAYKQKMQEWHPDRFRTKRGVEVSNAVSKIVNNAKDQIYRQRGWR